MKVADFFCGAGGFSEGFRQAGFTISFALDYWEPAITTFMANKPEATVLQENIIRISELPDEEFHKIVPDTEIIIGSPPCIAFSSSNKSGNGDKSMGIKLMEAYLKIVARKKYKQNSILKYWILENVPNIQKYIKKEYKAEDLELDGDFTLKVITDTSRVYNAKYFGAPTNRKRFFCGEFPEPKVTHSDDNLILLNDVIDAFNRSSETEYIYDCCYPGFKMRKKEVTDYDYSYNLEEFEWAAAKRLKTDRGYMGKMSFPERNDRPARTVMATMSACSRESMILSNGEGGYRLPTIREIASMMSYPIDYRFYGISKTTKYKLVGNAVPPKMSFAIAKAIAKEENRKVPHNYTPILPSKNYIFYNLNGQPFPPRKEKPRKDVAKFKYHIPYLIINAYRVELTNYHSDFDAKKFRWDVEIHYSQGRKRARIYKPDLEQSMVQDKTSTKVDDFSKSIVEETNYSYKEFQRNYCIVSEERKKKNLMGPHELLSKIRKFIDENFNSEMQRELIKVDELDIEIPQAIIIGYITMSKIINKMDKIEHK